ncbi:MAG: hypothetical protein O7E57_03375 [Gammaproteobacteria bacterium]|nr:hypothetical protein [Gammaproteobacteria bacterium]
MNYPPSDAAVEQAFEKWLSSGEPTGTLTRSIEVERSWDETPRTVTLSARYEFAHPEGKPRLTAILDGVEVSLDEPLRLKPVYIPKPWGREIWHSGIEARGESHIVGNNGASLPLSHYLALAPQRLCRGEPVVLLKVLDPRPEPVLGELYLEVHENKREVYVVTHVDTNAWPGGEGRIRFGANQAKRREYGDDNAFRSAYLRAVQKYRQIRTAIDSGEQVDEERERQARVAMEQFTELKPLKVGDVVTVPTWLPHSLQHGVRVVEFQTPVFERHIISFPQKVLTQEHWDSEIAIKRMTLEAPAEPDFVELCPGVERIASFDDFNVCRLTLTPNARFNLPQQVPYALCIALGGGIRVGALSLAPGEACFVPHSALQSPVGNVSGQTEICLVAARDL